MTLFQCRRFQFFDLERIQVDIQVKECLKGSEVKCGTSGRGRIMIGDSEGLIHSVSRNMESQTVAKAHQFGVAQIQQLKLSPHIFTLGEDEHGVYSIKVWNETIIEQMENSKSQLNHIRSISLIRHKMNVIPTKFAAHENLQLLAVGYSDGYLQLFRGELSREKNLKPRTLLDGDSGEITGLSFKTIDFTVILFVSTKTCTLSFDVTSKDKEMKLQVDKNGCETNCNCASDDFSEDHFLVGRNDAVYCYTPEGRGNCYGFDGEKYMLYFFRGYLLILTKLGIESYNITIFDCANKYVGFSSALSTPEQVMVAVGEWGTLYIISSNGTFWQFRETDLQTKMSILYKKYHYDLAIKVAKSNNFDADGMADIFRQYGDHLYAKGDLDGAIRQYGKTVGKLEPSYVVRKYLDASRVLNLLEYLEVIHKSGYATPDLTTLLLNCLTKLKLNEKIEIYVKDPSCDFLEPETAIKVFRKGGMWKQAYELANKQKLYGCALQILFEDMKDPCKEDLYNILEKTMKDENANVILKKYGTSIVHLVGQTDGKSSDGWKKIVKILCESPLKRDIVELFIAKKEVLIPLLENISKEFDKGDGPLMNLLLESYLYIWAPNKETDIATREKILDLLSKAPECPTWDWSRALFACKMFDFNKGEIMAFEKLGLYNDLLAIRYQTALKSKGQWPEFIETCRKYAGKKPSLWKDAFYIITAPNESHAICPQDIVEEILRKLLEENLMEPLPILDVLCQTNLRLGSVRSFLTKVLDRTLIEEDEKTAKKLEEETLAIRSQIHNIKTRPSVFQTSRCGACQQKLDFPSIHFLCSHSFHQQCFENYASNDRDCPVCWVKNKEIIGAEHNNKPTRAALDADFNLKFSTAKSNTFSVLSDFFGRGIFRDEDEARREAVGPKKSVEKIKFKHSNFDDDKLTEGRLRLKEGMRGGIEESAPTVESIFDRKRREEEKSRNEGWRHQQPQSQVSTSLPFPRVTQKQFTSIEQTIIRTSSPPADRKKFEPQSISSAVSKSKAVEKNPFDEEDDANNPFLKDEPKQIAKNPFEEDDDYDPSLNPFSD